MEYFNSNKKWLLLLTLVFGLLSLSLALYFGLKPKSEKQTSDIISPSLTETLSPMNQFMSFFYDGSSTFTIEPQDVYKKLWNALKKIVPDEIFSQISCSYNTNLDTIKLFTCLYTKIIFKNIHISGNSIDIQYLLQIYQNFKLCELIGTLHIINLLMESSLSQYKIEKNSNIISVFIKESNIDNYVKIFKWDNVNQKIQFFGPILTQFEFINDIIKSIPEIGVSLEPDIYGRKIASLNPEIIKMLKNIDIKDSLWIGDVSKYILFVLMIFPNELKIDCKFCEPISTPIVTFMG